MLSAVILSRHSYGAMHLVVQPPDQRSVHFGPLVLETNLLKNQRLQQIKTNLSHAYYFQPSAIAGRSTHYCVHWTIPSTKTLGWLTSSLYGHLRTSMRGRGTLNHESVSAFVFDAFTSEVGRYGPNSCTRYYRSEVAVRPQQDRKTAKGERCLRDDPIDPIAFVILSSAHGISPLASLKFTNFPRCCP